MLLLAICSWPKVIFADNEADALIKDLAVPAKCYESIRELGKKGPEARSAVPALIRVLRTPNGDEPSGREAANALALIDVKNRDAFRSRNPVSTPGNNRGAPR
jgi:hypothetical protein